MGLWIALAILLGLSLIGFMWLLAVSEPGWQDSTRYHAGTPDDGED